MLCILLAMGRFETEINLTQHSPLKESFRYAKLIGLPNDQDDLKILVRSSKKLLNKKLSGILTLIYKLPNG